MKKEKDFELQVQIPNYLLIVFYYLSFSFENLLHFSFKLSVIINACYFLNYKENFAKSRYVM